MAVRADVTRAEQMPKKRLKDHKWAQRRCSEMTSVHHFYALPLFDDPFLTPIGC